MTFLAVPGSHSEARLHHFGENLLLDCRRKVSLVMQQGIERAPYQRGGGKLIRAIPPIFRSS